MSTKCATSPDGLAWTWHGTALSGTPGRWDSRGTRVTSVDFGGGGGPAYYDGRARPAPAQAPAPPPRLPPVAEALPEDVLEQVDVRLEARDEFLALLPAQRLPLPAVPLQVTLQRAGEGGRGPAGDPGAHGAARTLGQRHGAVGERGVRVGGEVLPGDLGQQAGRDAEEHADLVHGPGGVVAAPPGTQHED